MKEKKEMHPLKAVIILFVVIGIPVLLFNKCSKALETTPISEVPRNELAEKYSASIKATTVMNIEDLQMIKIKTLGSNSMVQEFSNVSVFDTDGNEYPYTYFIHGRYEVKQTGELYDYSMILGYKTREDIENVNGTCLEYYNKTSGQTYSIIDDSRSN